MTTRALVLLCAASLCAALPGAAQTTSPTGLDVIIEASIPGVFGPTFGQPRNRPDLLAERAAAEFQKRLPYWKFDAPTPLAYLRVFFQIDRHTLTESRLQLELVENRQAQSPLRRWSTPLFLARQDRLLPINNEWETIMVDALMRLFDAEATSIRQTLKKYPITREFAFPPPRPGSGRHGVIAVDWQVVTKYGDPAHQIFTIEPVPPPNDMMLAKIVAEGLALPDVYRQSQGQRVLLCDRQLASSKELGTLRSGQVFWQTLETCPRLTPAAP